MVKPSILIAAVLTALAASIPCSGQQPDPAAGPVAYLGQPPPGSTPEIFAPGIISRAGFHLHSSLTFSPDGGEVYFTEYVSEPEPQGTIRSMKWDDGEWTGPWTAPFSGIFNDDSAVFSPDGQRLWFTSTRPVEEGDDTDDFNIWYVERGGGAWGDPVYGGDALNSPHSEWRLSFTSDRTIYLSSDRDDPESGIFDIFLSRPVESGPSDPMGEGAAPVHRYTEPVKMGSAVNTPVTEQVGFVAPDESYVVFYRHSRENRDLTGLYISFRSEDGSWSTGVNMGEVINAPPEAVTQAATLSTNGRFLFFLRRRHEAIYWVDARVLEELRSGRR